MRRFAVAVLLATVSLTGCSVFGLGPSPTTTYTGANGESITVDWVDYPALAGVDGETLLGRADQTDLEPEARALIRDLRAAIDSAAGLTMVSVEPERDWFNDENWYQQGGNGYGGDSMLITVNCCELATDSVPNLAQWQSVLDAASEVTIAAGLGTLELQHNSAAMRADPNWSKEYHDQFCNLDDGGCWFWSAWATDGVQWVDFTIQNAVLDPKGEAETSSENADGRFESIRISYGATVVRSGKSGEYARAIRPFLGLEQPAATTSD
jgi:hypothetical protein